MQRNQLKQHNSNIIIMRKALYLFIAFCCSTAISMAGNGNTGFGNSNSNSNSNSSSSSSVTITLTQTTFDLTFGSSFIEIQKYVSVSNGSTVTSDDIIVYYYTMDDDGNDDESSLTTVQPKNAGNYHVVVCLASDTTITADAYFYVAKVTPEVTVDADGYTITYGDDPVDFEALVSNNADDAEITIVYTDADGNTYTDQPTDVGEYTVTITVEGTSNSEEVTVTTTLAIVKAESNATFDLEEEGYTLSEGDDPIDFTELVDNPDNAEITITYVDADGNEYDEQPTEPGEYTVVITVEETDNNEGTEVETTLTITANEEDNVQTAIESIETSYSIKAAEGKIVISTDEALEVSIYDLSGRLATKATVEGTAQFNATKGINIVVLSNGATKKLVVK